MTNQTVLAPSYFYRTGPMPCPYLPGQVERNLFTELRGVDARALHNRLAKAGFRRSHHIVYRPACGACSACVPLRVRADLFRPSRSQRRIRALNAELIASVQPARATMEQYALFLRYQRARHGGGEMAAMSLADYRAMVEESPVDTLLAEFRDPSGTLIACALIDRLDDGLSAVYSFFAPEETRRSLGTYIILWLFAEAPRHGLPHVYLGYWVPTSDKMAYKSRFRPAEILGPSGWTELAPPAEEQLR
jgi:leucyl-tRNA---protein transferase